MTIQLLNAPVKVPDLDSLVRPGAPGCEVVGGAIVPPRLASTNLWQHSAGVYRPDGEVVASSLQRRRYGPLIVPYRPNAIRQLRPRRLKGTAMFGGVLVDHYGHFTLESTARLWWLVESGFDGQVVFQAEREGVEEKAFIARFLTLLGIRDRVVVAREPLQFDEVVVPEAALVLRESAYSNAQSAFRALGRRIEATLTRDRPRKLYVSRTCLDRGLAIGESVVEAAFAREGFTILHPELVPLDTQISLICGADRVAGLLGSGMHNLMYADAKPVTYICREAHLNPTYPMLDSVIDSEARYIFGGRRHLPNNDVLADPYLLDVRTALDVLQQIGWLSPSSIETFDEAELRRTYLAEWHLQRSEHGTSQKAEQRLTTLLLAAALRPGDARTLQRLAVTLLEAKRFEAACHFAREYLDLVHWSGGDTEAMVARFRELDCEGLALNILAHRPAAPAQANDATDPSPVVRVA